MFKLEKLGGIAAFSLALIYISAFVFYFTILDFPASEDIQQKLNFLRENHWLLSLFNLIGYVIFGIILAQLTLALHQRLQHSSANLSRFASVFGFIWVALVTAAGMIANIGLNKVTSLSLEQPDLAMTIWTTVNVIVEGIGGGNEIVGGIWVLAISIAGICGRELNRGLSYFGLFVGAAGIATIYPDELFTEIFGLSQIFWFIWIGIWLLKRSESNSSPSKS